MTQLAISSIGSLFIGKKPGDPSNAGDAALRAAADKLEAGFLAEMLKSTGLGEAPANFGGGIGEGQFASFMRNEQAERMVQAGGIGLAESLYQSLKERVDGK